MISLPGFLLLNSSHDRQNRRHQRLRPRRRRCLRGHARQGGRRAAAGVARDAVLQWTTKSCPTSSRPSRPNCARMADVAGCGLVVTTGGTGPAPRDVTPEATAAVCTKLLPGFGELMRAASLKHVADRHPFAPDRRHPGKKRSSSTCPAGPRPSARTSRRCFPRFPTVSTSSAARASRPTKP